MDNPGKVTIIDVARAAGVSIATVSHVLNGTKTVSEDLRQRVHVAVTGLDYRPSHHARSLRRKRSATVGVLLSGMANKPINQLLKGIVDTLTARGNSTLIADSEGSSDREAKEMDRFLHRSVDGCIIEPVGGPAAGLAGLAGRIPCVVVGDQIEGSHVTAVVPDLRTGITEASLWALRRDPRTAFVASHVDTAQRQDAFAGYLDAARQAGINLQPDLICTEPPTPEGGHKAVLRLAQLDPPVTAVIVSHALMTVGAIRMWQDLPGRDRMSLVGIDAGAWYGALHAGVGMVAIPSYEMGATAVELLGSSGMGDQGQVVKVATTFLPSEDRNMGVAANADLPAVGRVSAG